MERVRGETMAQVMGAVTRKDNTVKLPMEKCRNLSDETYNTYELGDKLVS